MQQNPSFQGAYLLSFPVKNNFGNCQCEQQTDEPIASLERCMAGALHAQNIEAYGAEF
jgi:hypothetical protein